MLLCSETAGKCNVESRQVVNHLLSSPLPKARFRVSNISGWDLRAGLKSEQESFKLQPGCTQQKHHGTSEYLFLHEELGTCL